jgi:hypothetical protein
MQFPLSFQILAKKLGIFPSIGAGFEVDLDEKLLVDG